MLKKLQIVWCSSPESFVRYKDADAVERADYAQLSDPVCDMKPYGWIKVGSAEVTYTFDPVEAGVHAALAACDKAEAKLREELNDKLAEILEIRQQLLCLPSPKESFNDQ